MRPLGPSQDSVDDSDAPLSALTDAQSFWDHLGATRADEYAQDDILPARALPKPPAPVAAADVTAQEVRAGHSDPFSVAHCRLGSLDDTLQAMDGVSELRADPDARATSLSHGASVAALAAAQDEPAPRDGLMAAPQMRGRAAPTPKARRRRVADSRLGYRLQRFWLTPTYRNGLKFGVPLCAAAVALAGYFSNEANRQVVSAHIETVYAAFVDRPEFMVTALQWPDVTPELDAALRARLDIDLPRSSFRLDLDALRAEVEALDWVRSADLRLLSDGVLALGITEREPAILWRSQSGLELLDADGVRVAHVASRDLRPDLPLIAGTGANGAIREALDLLDAASPLGSRVLGLVRMGERRWDVVLDRDQRIRLPETGALPALERVIALEQAQDLLSRDIVIADLRNPARPVLQISAGAMETLRDIRSQSLEALQ